MPEIATLRDTPRLSGDVRAALDYLAASAHNGQHLPRLIIAARLIDPAADNAVIRRQLAVLAGEGRNLHTGLTLIFQAAEDAELASLRHDPPATAAEPDLEIPEPVELHLPRLHLREHARALAGWLSFRWPWPAGLGRWVRLAGACLLISCTVVAAAVGLTLAVTR